MSIWRFFLKLLILLLVCLVLGLGYGRARLLWTETEEIHDAAPVHGHWVQTHDAEIYVQEYGPQEGKPIVLIHGTGAWSGTWASNLSAMTQAGFHVVALDLPPFGYSSHPSKTNYSRLSQAQRILETIDALQLSHVVLIGHSFGGGPAIEAAMLAQGKVSSLILVDAALGLSTPMHNCSRDSATNRLLGIRPLRTTLMATVITEPAFSSYLLKSFVAKKEVVTKERLAIYQQPFMLRGYTAGLGDWAYEFALDCDDALSKHEAEYPKLAIPVALLWGELDSITPLTQGQHIQALLPHATLEVMPGVGHIPQIEDVALFNATLSKVLSGLAVSHRISPQ